MKIIGIFLGYAPEQPINNQGIGRLIGFLMHGILKKPDVKIILAAPAWYKETLLNFLKEQRIDSQAIEIITTPNVPYIIKVKKFLTEKKPRITIAPYRAFFLRLIKLSKTNLWLIGIRLVTTKSSIVFLSLLIISGIIGISLFFVFMPLILAAIFYLIYKIARKSLKRKLNTQTKKKINAIKDKYFSFNIIKQPLKSLKYKKYAHLIYNELRKHELKKLINIINKRKDVHCWYIPSLFWPEIKYIKATTVVAAPDIVFAEFPTLFLKDTYALAHRRALETLKSGDHYICYSDHVKQKHLVENIGIPSSHISIIHHGVVALDDYFHHDQRKRWRNKAIDIITGYQRKYLAFHPYLSSFNFKDAQFIFYSSQMRPYKNFYNLIRAFEILLRKKYINIKLFLTADITYENNEALNYIHQKDLTNDVIFFPNVSSEVLAALNHLAICSVNPTLFEGGFPFTFTEAYSVGTPSIMSNINVTSSLISDEYLSQKMLFDPYDLNDMVAKIEWAIKHREELFELQAPLYEQFKRRTWEVVADEYISLMKEITEDTAA